MKEITKQTQAGEVIIRVTFRGCDEVRAYLADKEIGTGYPPLKTPRVVNGKTLVAHCGTLGLTEEDVAAIQAALADEATAWMLSPEGVAHRESIARWDRVVDRNERVALESDINKWPDA